MYFFLIKANFFLERKMNFVNINQIELQRIGTEEKKSLQVTVPTELTHDLANKCAA